MSRRRRTTDDPNTTPGCSSVPPESSSSEDQLRLWAEMIAEGQAPFPEELAPAGRERLVALVRARLRCRLVRLIARTVAIHIYRKPDPVTEDTSNA